MRGKTAMTKLYYFSGTGNTLWSAKQIAAFLEKASPSLTPIELFNIGGEMQKPPGIIEAEKVIILFPAYAYQSPLLVRNFLIRTEIHSPYIAAFVTCGSDPGGSLGEIYRILKRKKITLNFAGRIPTVENYIPIFGPPKEAVKEKRLLLQKHATEEAAAAILAGTTNKPRTFRPLSVFVSSLFRFGKTLFVKGYKLGGECNGCGLCAKLCPAAAIAMVNGKPRFSAKCEHCQACLNWCPRRAIRYIRLKSDTPRYHHPEVSLGEMVGR
jgi:ferredoxin